MKCRNCAGRLTGDTSFCPYCGVRQDVNLRQIHFRDLGTDSSLPCPHCSSPLDVIEFDTDPSIRIERCTTCYGTFFNPGELEALLDAHTHPLVWLDAFQIDRIASDYGQDQEISYLPCPMCSDRMGRINFGGRSGVVIDQCNLHGVWLEGSELRRLIEWWRAGGKLIFQQHEAEKARRHLSTMSMLRRTTPLASPRTTSAISPTDWQDIPGLIALIGGLLLSIFR